MEKESVSINTTHILLMMLVLAVLFCVLKVTDSIKDAAVERNNIDTRLRFIEDKEMAKEKLVTETEYKQMMGDK